MQVAFELPEDLAHLLAESPAGLTQRALEALALEGLRAGELSVAQARRLLGIESRYEMDGFLKNHGIFLPDTAEDVMRDAEIALFFAGRSFRDLAEQQGVKPLANPNSLQGVFSDADNLDEILQEIYQERT